MGASRVSPWPSDVVPALHACLRLVASDTFERGWSQVPLSLAPEYTPQSRLLSERVLQDSGHPVALEAGGGGPGAHECLSECSLSPRSWRPSPLRAPSPGGSFGCAEPGAQPLLTGAEPWTLQGLRTARLSARGSDTKEMRTRAGSFLFQDKNPGTCVPLVCHTGRVCLNPWNLPGLPNVHPYLKLKRCHGPA